MSGHRRRQVREFPKRREVMPLQVGQRGVDRRQFEVGIGKCPSMAGNVLHHRQHAARHQSFGGRPAKRRHGFRCLAVGTRPDDVAGAFDRHVEDRQAVARNSIAHEVESMQPGQQPRRPLAGFVIVPPESAKRSCRRIVGRQRGPQPLHAAAFLVDEDRRVPASHAVPHFRDEVAELLGLADVSGKQYEAPGALAPVEAGLLAAERLAGTAQNHRF
jgi:hypothetical protein